MTGPHDAIRAVGMHPPDNLPPRGGGMTERLPSGGRGTATTAAHVAYHNCPTTLAHNSPLPVVAGVEVRTDDQGRYNLNALHRASGGEKRNGPTYWLALDSTQKLINELKQQNTEIPVITSRGRGGGTYAHELLAIAYASSISPSFHLLVNQVFINFRTGKLQQQSVPQNFSEALRLAAILVEENQRLQVDSQALHRISDSSGSYTPTQAAKTLQIKPKALFAWLSTRQWIYRDSGGVWCGYQARIDQGHLVHKSQTIDNGGRKMLVQQVRVTAKGLALITKRLSEAEAV